jgi:hypothetical protein
LDGHSENFDEKNITFQDFRNEKDVPRLELEKPAASAEATKSEISLGAWFYHLGKFVRDNIELRRLWIDM